MHSNFYSTKPSKNEIASTSCHVHLKNIACFDKYLPNCAYTSILSTKRHGAARQPIQSNRQVEQLKAHLQNMGGDAINRQRQGLHRPRPRPKRAGDHQAMAHRLVAPLPLSEAPRSVPRRSGPRAGAGAAGGGGWAGAHGTAREKAQSDRARLQPGHRVGGGGGHDSIGTSPHTGKSVPTPIPLAEDSRAHAVQSSPSPPRRYDRRPSDARPSPGTVITVAPVEQPSSGSPVRQIRASKLRSPERTSQGAATAVDALRGYPSARSAGVAVGPFMSQSKVKADQSGQEGANRGRRLGADAAAAAAAAGRQTDHGLTNDRAVSGTKATIRKQLPQGVFRKKSLLEMTYPSLLRPYRHCYSVPLCP